MSFAWQPRGLPTFYLWRHQPNFDAVRHARKERPWNGFPQMNRVVALSARIAGSWVDLPHVANNVKMRATTQLTIIEFER